MGTQAWCSLPPPGAAQQGHMKKALLGWREEEKWISFSPLPPKSGVAVGGTWWDRGLQHPLSSCHPSAPFSPISIGTTFWAMVGSFLLFFPCCCCRSIITWLGRGNLSFSPPGDILGALLSGSACAIRHSPWGHRLWEGTSAHPAP